ncbi:MAG: ABC transporter substrate-binding protein [Thauera sp.]|jgi:iron complex transport system substrate-binding protein|nr:ABC transporter substrate-binding protein [Thauera sp.]
MMRRSIRMMGLMVGLLGLGGSTVAAAAEVEPVEVEVCGELQRYDAVPQRVVTHDVNITEMLLHLGLGERLVGYSGLRGNKNVAPQYRAQLAGVPELSTQGMNLEAVIGAGADFVFGGWSYGFREGEVTPAVLREFGIQSYVLTESCVRKVARTAVSLEDTFNDMLNLGRIFRIEQTVEALVAQQRAELQAVTDALQGIKARPKVLVYDSGANAFTTVGRFGMPNAMIEAAGGRNIFDDIPSNWPRGNWENVVERNPDWIVIIDYDHPGPQGKIDFLRSKAELATVTALQQGNFVVLTYAEATPGPGNVAAVRRLAQAFHPGRLQ